MNFHHIPPVSTIFTIFTLQSDPFRPYFIHYADLELHRVSRDIHHTKEPFSNPWPPNFVISMQNSDGLGFFLPISVFLCLLNAVIHQPYSVNSDKLSCRRQDHTLYWISFAILRVDWLLLLEISEIIIF